MITEVHEPLIQLSAVRKAYPEGASERVIFEHLDATISAGELTVLLGRSGTGKSTLLNLISGIDLPDSGSVSIDGSPLTELSERERTLYRRRHIGFVFQFFNLVSTLTVEENLLLPLELNGTRGARAQRIVRDHLDQVGLGGREDSFPDRLSGGEQQRVAIVRALVHDPLLILADEPTGNLDVHTGHDILALLARLTRESGKTLLMVTHSVEAEAYADRILVLEDGRLLHRQTATAVTRP
ncbi:MAG: ABC transporter ATP-binding protein [Gammaproteobacteria bacterium]|nr:ABC transporter ATP-binding protein [Gammaproteobacteria bacterium]